MILSFDLIELKIGTPFTPAAGNSHAILGFSTPFCFRVSMPKLYRTETDGRAY